MTQVTEPAASPDYSLIRIQIPMFVAWMVGVKILPLVFARLGLSLLPSALLSGVAIAIAAYAITLTTKRILPLGKWTGPFLGATVTAGALVFSFIDGWVRTH